MKDMKGEFLLWRSGNEPTGVPEDVGLIPGLIQWAKDLVCHELWCRLQMQLRSCIAVAVA